MNLAQIDLNLLVALDALINERHVTRAAERVGLSQPAMSNSLARLRLMFGDELLVRVGREYQLTALAVELQEPLHELLQLAEETVQRRPHFEPARDVRRFTIVASDYAAYLVLQPLLLRVSREAPGVSLQIRHTTSGQPEKLVSDINIGLWPSPDLADAELPFEILFQDRWVCAVWTDNRRVEETVTLDQFMRLPHIVYGSGIEAVRGMADRVIRNTGAPRHIQASAESFFLLPFLLQGSDMVAFVHERLGQKLAAAANIRLVEPRFETPPVAEAMYWHTRNTSDPAHVWVRDLLREISAEL
jgi:LysR family nod box-dependent transcriptional activator